MGVSRRVGSLPPIWWPKIHPPCWMGGVEAGRGWGWRQGGGGGGGREGVGVIKNFQPFSTMVDHFMGLFIPGHLYSCYEQASQW